MYIPKQNLQKAFSDLEENVYAYRLPTWDELPNFELYMEQVTAFIGQKLAFFNTASGSKLLTAAMVNNYVKLGYLPAPVKKKYNRVHLSCLLILCTLKQTLDIADIVCLLPNSADEAEAKTVYDSFVRNQKKAFAYVTENVKSVADPILTKESDNQERMNDLVMQVAVSANLFKILGVSITRGAKNHHTDG